MKGIVLRFGLLALALLALFQLSKYSLFFQNRNDEWQIAVFAALFLAFGYISSRLLVRQKTQAIENQSIKNILEPEKFKSLGISKREYEVLQEMASGLSNLEIAEKLFIAESTVKTHVSNLLLKLDARRRTQAITIAKNKGILK